MEQKVLAAQSRYKLLTQQDNVIVALSGGADSVALFHFLLQNKSSLGITLSAAHFEHGLRGEASLQDAAYVKRLCAENGVQLYIEYGNMSELQKPKGLGTEAWARQLRHSFLTRLAQQYGAKIALAHTLTDNAETVLFHAIRGSGPKGLSGIPPQRPPFIRPLILASRQEVEEYCKAHNLHYVQDATNTDIRHSRNRLRHSVMPLLEQAHPGAAQNLARMAHDMLSVDELLHQNAVDALQKAGAMQLCKNSERPVQGSFLAQPILQLPAAVRTKALALLCGRAATRDRIHRLEQVLHGKIASAQIGSGVTAQLHKGSLVLSSSEPFQTNDITDHKQFAYEIPLSEGTHNLPGGYCLHINYISAQQWAQQSKKTTKKGLTFVADCDKILKYGILRTRRDKDTFTQRLSAGTKTLKKWMNQAAIPPNERYKIPLVAANSTVLWVWGAGFCESVAPTAETKNILLINTCYKGEEGNNANQNT